MSQQPVVAVLGLGAMGHAFAANLLKKGFTVRGWNRTRAKGEDLVAAGLTLSDSAAQAVEGADVVIAMLADGATTRATLKPGAESTAAGGYRGADGHHRC
jgi:3-hydroxyisobutyrate dehydrogenase and related beta-hydroxyacid dehydrogenases